MARVAAPARIKIQEGVLRRKSGNARGDPGKNFPRNRIGLAGEIGGGPGFLAGAADPDHFVAPLGDREGGDIQ